MRCPGTLVCLVFVLAVLGPAHGGVLAGPSQQGNNLPRLLPLEAQCSLERPCKVIVDQDCGTVADTNSNAVLALLLDPTVQVLGVTTVYGDNWEAVSFGHCFRLLELFNRTDVPILRGAEQPLVRTAGETYAWETLYNYFPWKGMWNKDDPKNRNFGPGVLAEPRVNNYGSMREGCSPGLAKAACDCSEANCHVGPADQEAAPFIVQQINRYPGEVIVVALGPFTNVAIARMLDPSIVTKAHLWVMGAALNSGNLPQHRDIPRHETNMWFDEVASRHVLRKDQYGRNWRSVSVVPADTGFVVPWSEELVARVTEAGKKWRAAQYVSDCRSPELIPICDELAAMLVSIPHLAKKRARMYMDTDISQGAGSGNTLTWESSNPPAQGLAAMTEVYLEPDVAAVQDAFVALLSAGPPALPGRICAPMNDAAAVADDGYGKDSQTVLSALFRK